MPGQSLKQQGLPTRDSKNPAHQSGEERKMVTVERVIHLPDLIGPNRGWLLGRFHQQARVGADIPQEIVTGLRLGARGAIDAEPESALEYDLTQEERWPQEVAG
jgi:hypothetical protein